jgi:hypothetical protein
VNKAEFEWKIYDTPDYRNAKRAGGPMIERLRGESLVAVALATGRSVRQLLEDNGYTRPANIASDDVQGG